MEIIKKYRILFTGLAILLVGGIGYIFYRFNPETSGFFLPCPFKLLTGYDCPGCGSQRAVHALLHGDIQQALRYNPLFVIAIPYVVTGFIFNREHVKEKYPKLRKTLFGQTSIYIILLIILVFGIVRNL
ncbi:DUF2752 domain-containing protein [Elizabethkingia meningoseptica]|uniref:DUF2752 domain-containing protein n=1 Tax=Elizabethkingia meningoseptica TaxID=238 RepID=UPI0023B107D8|nr:DUF2752 domain-containing protein [Elizabethkingia meningoseptica]MDE5438231.1 DUF2752 domain-containing protein [Elizabethkingia meningoseptica]MDE5508774.1 DUF2752 domain-containing protein [Elizabethkingia meningoseptica]MDE5515767.1 DUF2752 domain-containing protein [Elizabethkingia meningoseptica]MDE5527157.1 DUF2752 domain-containing protein [Elizabethkingia meningoseptica]MDE5530183.1 DUF2752 domain-containing protein [Elizabethkingia meningoseptica]